jgi:hypothetical protein
LYAIVDFFEKRNFFKCNKYLDRIKYIKKINDEYNKSNNKSNIITEILQYYTKQIKRKYKMIHDYPFILSKELVNINNNGIIKCIYRYLRTNNINNIIELIDKYKKSCSNKKAYKYNNSELTIVDTDEV